MHIYLIHHAETVTDGVADPYNHPLSGAGEARAQELARMCQQWHVELLVTSMMLRSMQTADAVTALLPHVERWDLAELEDLTRDDLMYDPSASHLVSTWTPEQLETGLARLWVRVMAAAMRVQIYADAQELQNVVIIAGERVLRLLLLNWCGQDWTDYCSADIDLTPGHISRITRQGEQVKIDWVNQFQREPDA